MCPKILSAGFLIIRTDAYSFHFLSLCEMDPIRSAGWCSSSDGVTWQDNIRRSDDVLLCSNFCIGLVNAHLQDTSYASCSFLSVFETMFKPSFIIHVRDFAAPGYWVIKFIVFLFWVYRLKTIVVNNFFLGWQEYNAIKEFTIILIYMAKILDGVAEKRFHKQLCMTGSKLSQQIIDIIFLWDVTFPMQLCF